jgi:hypothetical protein
VRAGQLARAHGLGVSWHVGLGSWEAWTGARSRREHVGRLQLFAQERLVDPGPPSTSAASLPAHTVGGARGANGREHRVHGRWRFFATGAEDACAARAALSQKGNRFPCAAICITYRSRCSRRSYHQVAVLPATNYIRSRSPPTSPASSMSVDSPPENARGYLTVRATLYQLRIPARTLQLVEHRRWHNQHELGRGTHRYRLLLATELIIRRARHEIC